MNDLFSYFNSRVASFYSTCEKSKEKYEKIWSYYDEKMPNCMETCNLEVKRKSSENFLEGPQGIYWIGEVPKIFIIGREHFGWFGSKSFTSGKSFIYYAPLEFAYFTVQSMGSYWGIIKKLICSVLDEDVANWDSILRFVALSNACKCLPNKDSLKWYLHQQCFKCGYMKFEIETVNAPINIVFTKTYNFLSQIYPNDSIELERTSEFLVKRRNNQIFIECSHPVRQSNVWRKALIQIVRKYYTQVIEADLTKVPQSILSGN